MNTSYLSIEQLSTIGLKNYPTVLSDMDALKLLVRNTGSVTSQVGEALSGDAEYFLWQSEDGGPQGAFFKPNLVPRADVDRAVTTTMREWQCSQAKAISLPSAKIGLSRW